jgi:sugar phosphate isomerase/epimerase
VQSIGVWREPVHEVGLEQAARMLADSGLRMSSYCRGGFFTATEGPARRAALDDNRRAIEETAALASVAVAGSEPVLILVVGGLPKGSRDLVGARACATEAIAELASEAQAAQVRLAIEPMHPMYASDRSVVSTLGLALDMASNFDPGVVGVAVDSFHVWWDPDLEKQLLRAGKEGRITSYQVCDWKTPLTADVLLSRHYPGEGSIDFGWLTRTVVAAGFTGDVEVELFNAEVWNDNPDAVVSKTVSSFAQVVSPHLPPTHRT